MTQAEVDIINRIAVERNGRTGECVECGLCCLLATPVKRVPKERVNDPDPEKRGGPDGLLLLERLGYRVARETRGYWFVAKWDPCPYYWFYRDEDGKHKLGCTRYDDRPDSCRWYPHENQCMWLVTECRCGYRFPHPGGDRADDIQAAPKAQRIDALLEATGAEMVAGVPTLRIRDPGGDA